MVENRCIEEDEIDLKELFSTIWRYKWLISIFSIVVTLVVAIYLVRQPNIYKSETILAPQGQKSTSNSLGVLAGFAGVDIGGGGEISVFSSMETVLKDYSFQVAIIRKYSLLERLENPSNLVFPFGLKFDKKVDVDNNRSQEEREFAQYKNLTQNILSLSEDKKSGLITLSAKSEDRFLAKELVDIYLKEITSHLREMDMVDINSKIEYYEKELERTTNIELQSKLSQLLSSLIQKRVLANANEFYIVKKITDPEVAFIKDEIKPKRGLIFVVTLISSIILAIFIALFIEFLKGGDSEKKS